MDVQEIPVDRLVEAGWNANRVSAALQAKIRRSLTEFGVVENLVVRPLRGDDGHFEVISGNHRLRLLRELGHGTAPAVVVELDDAQARLLAQALNRTRGADDPEAYAALLERVLERFTPAAVAGFLPESEATIERHLREYGQAREDRVTTLVPPENPTAPGSRRRIRRRNWARSMSSASIGCSAATRPIRSRSHCCCRASTSH
jgi:ParB family chromosome partitioning protein